MFVYVVFGYVSGHFFLSCTQLRSRVKIMVALVALWSKSLGVHGGGGGGGRGFNKV